MTETVEDIASSSKKYDYPSIVSNIFRKQPKPTKFVLHRRNQAVTINCISRW